MRSKREERVLEGRSIMKDCCKKGLQLRKSCSEWGDFPVSLQDLLYSRVDSRKLWKTKGFTFFKLCPEK